MKKILTLISASVATLALVLGGITLPQLADAATVTDAAQCETTDAIWFHTDRTWTGADAQAGFIDVRLDGVNLICIDGGVTVQLDLSDFLEVEFRNDITIATTPGTTGQGTFIINGDAEYSGYLTLENINYNHSRNDESADLWVVGDLTITDGSVVSLKNEAGKVGITAEGDITISDSTLRASSYYTGGADAFMYGRKNLTITNSVINLMAISDVDATDTTEAFIGAEGDVTIANSKVTTTATPASDYKGNATIGTYRDGNFMISGSDTVVTMNITCPVAGENTCNAFFNKVMPTLNDGLRFYKDGVDMTDLLSATDEAGWLDLFTIEEGESVQFVIRAQNCQELNNCPMDEVDDLTPPETGFLAKL